MRLVIVADTYPPARSSGAVQLRDLSLELVRQGHEVTMLIASPGLESQSRIDGFKGVRVVRLRSPRAKDAGWIRRAFGEIAMPFSMLLALRHSAVANERWDGVVWYSPSIFLGPIASSLKRRSRCRGYLIVRDIFPEWALDMGLMSRGLPYLFFQCVARYQYRVADVIGIQTPGNSSYFAAWIRKPGRRLEVLHNWLAEAPDRGCSIQIATTPLAGRKILVYAGNMGIAQGMGLLLQLAEQMRNRTDVGFVFVGRGSLVGELKRVVRDMCLSNLVFFDEIDPDEIPGLYAQCHIGLVALDPRHRTHNIPGKFLSYMQSGLPVLAAVNPGNDLVELIHAERVGRVCTDGSSVHSLVSEAEKLLDDIDSDTLMAARCRGLARRLFSPEFAAQQMVRALEVGGL
jgi:glycosyltransferase involved in cell wall biosynthesis